MLKYFVALLISFTLLLAINDLPTMVLTTIDGSRVSTPIFREKENAIIVISEDIHYLQTKKYDTFHWKILDIRNKPWYLPEFFYLRKFKKQKKIILNRKNQLLDALHLKPGNYQIQLSWGKIVEITKL